MTTAFANEWLGMRNPGTTSQVYGSAARIYTPTIPPYNYGTLPPNGWRSSWVMMTTTDGAYLSQVGFDDDPKYNSTHALYFYGYMDNNQYFEQHALSYGPTGGTSNNYQVAVEGSNIVGRANGVEIGSSSDNFSAYALAYDQEINYPEDSIPWYGVSAERDEYSNIEYYDKLSNSWNPLGYLQEDQPNDWSGLNDQWKSSGYFQSWDTAY